MQILNEVYFGKEYIKPLQLQLSKIRAKYKGTKIRPSNNIDPEILKFNRLAEKLFGFNSFSLDIQPDYSLNAYAWPVTNHLTDQERLQLINSVRANVNGFRYDKFTYKVDIISAIHIGLLNMDNITDEEIMGIMLHEIGHGFFEAVLDSNEQLAAASMCNKLMNTFLTVNKLILDKVTSGKHVTEEMINNDLSWIDKFKINLSHNLRKIKKFFLRESMADNLTPRLKDYTNEKFADTYAASYGYGSEVQSALTKMYEFYANEFGKPKKYTKLGETLAYYNQYMMEMLGYWLNILDEHPRDLARLKTSADYLKRELSKEGIDPKLKTQMIDDLNKVNKLIDDYINYPKDQDAMRLRRLYYIKLYEKCGGDIREKYADNNAIFAAIDAKYEQLKSKEK